jgi:transposase InsO family protein
MHYSTRFDPKSFRASFVADRKAGLKQCEILRKYRIAKSTLQRWLKRDSMESRRSTPHRQPRRLSAEVEQRIIEARLRLHWGPNRLSYLLGIPASTIYKVLKRYGINRLFPKNKLPVVRYEMSEPGALVHVDVKKLGTLGLYDDPRKRRRGPGHECMHVAKDDCTRTGYAEIHPNETAAAATAFLERMVAWFASIGVKVERVMTDHGVAYTSSYWRDDCQLLGIRHVLIPVRHPQTNGKVERLIRTISDEVLKGRAYGTTEARARALENYLAFYNTKRQHTALGGLTPFQKLVQKSIPGL